MPEINVTPQPAGLPSLPPEFLQQINAATSGPLQIMQHGQDTRANIMATVLQDALETSRQSKLLKESSEINLRQKQAEIDGQARQRAAAMGISVSDKDTAETLAPKFHKYAVDSATALHALYSPQVADVNRTQRKLQERRDAIIKNSVTPDIQRDALVNALTASSKIPNNIKETAIKSLRDPANTGKDLQSVVDKTLKQISEKGALGGALFSNANDVLAFEQAYDQEKEKIVSQKQPLLLQSVYADLQENNRLKNELTDRIDKNALPVWQATGKEGLSFIKNIGTNLGAGDTFNAHVNSSLLRVAGGSGTATGTTPPPAAPSSIVPTPAAQSPGVFDDPSKSLIAQVPGAIKAGVNAVGGAIGDTINSAFQYGSVNPYKALTGTGSAPPPTAADIGNYKSQIGYQGGPGLAASQSSLQKLFSHPIGQQAPDDRLVSTDPSAIQSVKAFVDKSDPSGKRSADMIQHLSSPDPNVKKLATKAFNTVLLMQANGVDPQQVMSNPGSIGNIPPVGATTNAPPAP